MLKHFAKGVQVARRGFRACKKGEEISAHLKGGLVLAQLNILSTTAATAERHSDRQPRNC